jgi:predicted AlkP superfamily phosphohydrolase/phosphomutase
MLEINRKFRDLCLDLMQHEEWDLFLATNFTIHHAGHRLWNTVNIKDDLPPDEKAGLEDALRQVYAACDEGIGKLVDAAGDDTIVMALSVHGMGVNQSRSWILSEMLQRVTDGRPPSRGVLRSLREAIPLDWRHAIKSRLPYNVRRRLTRFWQTKDHRWATTRAFALFSDTQGWVRVNLKEREAEGIVKPGVEYDAFCQEISEGLKTFVDADTGEPIIKDISRPHQVYEGEHLAELPDLIVRWSETSACQHRAVRSPTFGVIPWPTPGRNPEGRSGNHRGQGMLIAAGPGIKPGRTENGHILDLAPTILALLNQPVPADMEGKPLRLMH